MSWVCQGMKTAFYREFDRQVKAFGGYHNAHLHLDRAHTLNDINVTTEAQTIVDASHISLQKKHSLVEVIHRSPAFGEARFFERITEATDVMRACGTRLADTVVDVTTDGVGLTGLTWIMSHAQSISSEMTLRAGAYTPFGFRDDEPERWDLFMQAVNMADFIGSLPEADDREDYPDKIGFDEHCRRMVQLCLTTGKMLQIHTDQRNLPQEDGTERLIRVVRQLGSTAAPDGSPLVWVVHMISPTTYDEPRWRALLEGLLECNIGVISCPSGALGMRMIRPIQIPMYNSIARLLELAAAGVPLRIGSDNICDMCSPSTTADLGDEIFVLTAALRFYQPEILAKFAAGRSLDAEDRAALHEHLEKNDEEIARVLQRWPQG